MTTPIPQPPTIPFLGNVTAIDKELPLHSFALLAEKYGEIYQLTVLGTTASNSVRSFLTSAALPQDTRPYS